MLIAFAVALALRLAYLITFRDSPFFTHPIVDAGWHDEWAWAWARGESYGADRAFFRAPLYPFWLSLVYRLLGHDPWAVRLVQAVVGAGTAAALAGAGHRLAGRGVGLAAGLLAAAHGPLIFYDGELLIPNLLTALLAWTLFVLMGPATRRAAITAGLLVGLAAVARPNALVLLPLVAVRFRPSRRRAALVAALGLVPALVVTGLNARREGTFVFIAAQGGVNFAAGNHALASGRGLEIPELVGISSWREFPGVSRAVAEEAVGRPLDSREVSNWWLHRGLGWIRAHPGDAAALSARKALYLVNAYEIPNNRDLYFERPGPLRWLLWKTRWLAFPWGILFPLAVAGVVVGARDRELRGRVGVLAAWVVLYGASVVPFFVAARFRMGLVPPLVVLAGLALARPRALRGWGLAAALAAVVVANVNVAGTRLDNPAQELARLGHILVRDGRLAEGIEALERAHQAAPGDVNTAHILARAYADAGRPADALPLYEYVAGERPADADLRFDMAVEYLRLERYEDAAHLLEAVVTLAPDHAAAWVNLAGTYEEMGREEAAVEAYHRGIRLAPYEPLAYTLLGSLHLRRGDPRRAVDVLEAGVDRLQTSFDLRYLLAWAYREVGRPDLALEQLDTALHLDPEHAGARRMQEELQD